LYNKKKQNKHKKNPKPADEVLFFFVGCEDWEVT